MNLLIITSSLPYPLNSGGNQAQFNAIDFLAKNGINVSILFNKNKINNLDNLEELKNIWKNVAFYPYDWTQSEKKIESFFLRTVRKVFNKFVSKNRPFNRLDLEVSVDIESGFINSIVDIVVERNIDIVQVDFRYFLPLIYSLPDNVKTVFVQHEIQFVRNEIMLEGLKDTLPYQNFIYRKMKSDELAAMNNFDLVVTLTDNDKNVLLKNGVNVQVEASPASISNLSIDNNFNKSTNQLVFIGGSAHYPNKHGLQWFLDKVWGGIQERNNEVILNIIGKWDKNEITEFQNKYQNIRFLGFVDDLSYFLQNSLMVVPILIGSGMRMKIVEAANYGCPFVSTTKGVEGLNFKDNENCIITDDNEAFAKSVLELLADHNLQRRYSVGAKDVFNDHYSYEILGIRRLKLLNSLLADADSLHL